MDTTSKWNILEKALLKYLKQLIKDWGFISSEKLCTIHHQKKFHSRDGEKDITFDVVVEIKSPWVEKPSLYWFFECKNYNKNVSSLYVDAFSEQVRQIWQNIKPVIVTTKWLEERALNTATNKWIWLWVLNTKEDFDWILPRKGLLNKKWESNIAMSYYSNGEAVSYNSVWDFLVWVWIIKENKVILKNIDFPFIKISSIEKSISSAEKYIYKNGRLDKEKLCDYLNWKYGLEFDFDMKPTFDSENNEILWKTYIDIPKISINKNLLEDNWRFRFTLAHEIWHFILHRNRLKDRWGEIVDDSSSIGLEREEIIELSKLEYQANLFAKELLMPKESFHRVVKNFFIRERIDKGYVFVDHQPQNVSTYIRLQHEISRWFWVSLSAWKNRLREFDYVKYNIDPNKWKTIFSII